LIENGHADVNATDTYWETPLHSAFRSGRDWFRQEGYLVPVAVIEYLVQSGCDVNAARRDGGTALHLACSRGHRDAVQCLLDIGHANVEATNMYGMTALRLASRECHLHVLQCFETMGVAIMNTDIALHAAIAQGDLELVKNLVEKGHVSVKAVDANGDTP
jgi:ankyrin repeat protein